MIVVSATNHEPGSQIHDHSGLLGTAMTILQPSVQGSRRHSAPPARPPVDDTSPMTGHMVQTNCTIDAVFTNHYTLCFLECSPTAQPPPPSRAAARHGVQHRAVDAAPKTAADRGRLSGCRRPGCAGPSRPARPPARGRPQGGPGRPAQCRRPADRLGGPRTTR